MDEYEWMAQWRDDNDSWLRHSGWISTAWESEEEARERYDNLLNVKPGFSGVRLVRRIKAGPIEVVS